MHLLDGAQSWPDIIEPASSQQPTPVEMRSGIGLATGSDFRMAGDTCDRRIGKPQMPQYRGQTGVLPRSEWALVAALDFDANREVVATRTPAP